jgi:hypothetical protein
MGETGEWRFHYLPGGGKVIEMLNGTGFCLPLDSNGQPLWAEPQTGPGALERAKQAASEDKK